MLFTKPGIRIMPGADFPRALLGNGDQIPLSTACMEVLRTSRYGMDEVTAGDERETEMGSISKTDAIAFLQKRGLLVPSSSMLDWKGNTFGAFLAGSEEEESVARVLRSKRLFRHEPIDLDAPSSFYGSPCRILERRIERIYGVRHCIVLNSGTSALECSMKALGIGEGDKVAVPAFAYIGTIAAVMNVGAIPVICDIDDTAMLDPEKIEERLDPRVRAIICIHLRGYAANATAIREVANRNRLFLIEDCAQAFGTRLRERFVGTIGNVGCLSFHQHKVITCGEGGAVLTDDDGTYERLQILSDASRLFAHPRVLPGYPGHNFRLSEMQAAYLGPQIDRVDAIGRQLRKMREAIADTVNGLSGLSMTLNRDPNGSIPQSVYFSCDDSAFALKMTTCMKKAGLPASVLFETGIVNHDIYVYWPYVLELIGLKWDGAGVSDALLGYRSKSLGILKRTICFALGCAITDDDIDMARNVLRMAHAQATACESACF